MPEFLEKNDVAVKSIDVGTLAGFTPERVGFNGNYDRPTSFYNLGLLEVESADCGEQPVQVGIKVPSKNILMRFLYEASVMAMISDNLPSLADKMSPFFGLVRTTQGVDIGMIAQDFTKGGQLEALDWPMCNETREKLQSLGQGIFVEREFHHTTHHFGEPGGRIGDVSEKLIDFYGILHDGYRRKGELFLGVRRTAEEMLDHKRAVIEIPHTSKIAALFLKGKS